ncbi:protein of unknown function [Klenkia soli]|uniref:HTH cro/C1-type domain-containing protein n=1 Tax=Klenkia soli TaxID=1052260 RepID=A0A1H0U6S1_9ACTN|nr:XRE family transcriptional regulator [Klenkia soli]SDP61977.1 protein of unknown function [Klenkia soli]
MQASVVTERVRHVIEESGLAHGEFAARAGLDSSKMSKSLSGTRRFTSLDLANIAEVGGVSVDYLLGVQSPEPALAARAASKAEAVQSGAIEEARRIAKFRHDLDFVFQRQRPVAEIRPTRGGGYIKQGEALAEQAANLMSRADGQTVMDLESDIERVFGFDVARVPAGRDCDGVAWRDEHCAVIVVSTTDSATRQRFTMAHELGHLLAEDDQALHIDQDVMHAADKTEKRANVFAANFLMPASRLRRESKGWNSGEASDLDFAHLVMDLGVSPSALSWRLFNLGLASDFRRRQLATFNTARCASLAKRTKELAKWTKESQTRRPPFGLAADLLVAYDHGAITLRPFANLLEVDVDDVRSLLEQGGGGNTNAGKDDQDFEP